MKTTKNLHTIAWILPLFIAPFLINAQTINWDGGAGTDNWNDPNNWNTNTVPTASQEVVIDTNDVVIYGMASAKAILIEDEASLIIREEAILRVEGTSASRLTGIEIESDARVQIHGTVYMSGEETTDDIIRNEGNLQISGRLDITGPAAFAGIYNNNGILQNLESGQIEISGTTTGIENTYLVTNDGTLSIYEIADHGIFQHDSATVMVNSGSLFIDQTGLDGIRQEDHTSFNQTGGRIYLNGVEGAAIYNAGGYFQLRKDAFLEIGDAEAIAGPAILNRSGFNATNSPTFINNGQINIGEGASIGVDAEGVIEANAGNFYNESCGLLYIYTTDTRNISANYSQFTNDGVLITYGTPDIDSLNNRGVVYNLGEGMFFFAHDQGEILHELPTSAIWTACGTHRNWNNKLNWLLKETPVSSQSVLIPHTLRGPFDAFPILYTETTVRNVRIEPQATLTVEYNGILNVHGQNSAFSGIENYGNLTNRGQLVINRINQSGIYNYLGVLDNFGRIDIATEGMAGSFAIENYGTFTNHNCSFIFIHQDKEIAGTPPMVNRGVIHTPSSGTNHVDNTNGRIYNDGGGSFPDAGGALITMIPDTYTWAPCLNAQEGDWSDYTNWDTGLVPTEDIHVIIAQGLGKQQQNDNIKRKVSSANTLPPIIQENAQVRSITLEQNTSLTIDPCTALSISTHMQNHGAINVNGLLRIGTTYSGSGTTTINPTSGFVYQPPNTLEQTFPNCTASSDRCLSVNPTDEEFTMDGDGDNIPLCQNDLDELDNLNPPVSLQLVVFLEGGFAFLDKNKTMIKKGDGMSTDLTLSISQPFNQAPWMYNGSEKAEEIGGIPNDMTAWVLIEVYSDLNSPVPIAQRAALLRNDGRLVSPITGTNGIPFPSLQNGNSYYIAVRHRNHLAVMSSQAVLANNSELNYDFSAGQAQVLGDHQLVAMGGVLWALPAGDLNSDGIISVADYNFFISQAGQSNGVFDADLDLDGVVEVDDFNLYQQNSSKIGVSMIRY